MAKTGRGARRMASGCTLGAMSDLQPVICEVLSFEPLGAWVAIDNSIVVGSVTGVDGVGAAVVSG
jgi:hypothetical protein